MSTEAEPLELMNDISPADFLPAGLDQPEFPFFTVNTAGITVKEEMPENDWIEGTKAIVRAYGAAEETHIKMAFRVGDWLNFGEAKFGERWSQVLSNEMKSLIGKSKVSRFMWVAKAIPQELRDLSLRFDHHEKVAVCSHEEIKMLLHRAKEEDMTPSELREEVKILHPPKKEANEKAAKKKGKTDTKVTEEDAMAAAETLANFFDQAEEADGGVSKWPLSRLKKANGWMHPLEMVAKRVRNAITKHKKAAKKAE